MATTETPQGPGSAPVQTVDLFPDVTSGKFPKRVSDILRSNGRNVSSMEAEFNTAIKAGGNAKAEAVNKYYKMFDQVQGSTEYSNLLTIYDRQREQITDNATQERVAKKVETQAVEALPKEAKTEEAGKDGSWTLFAKNAWNAFGPTLVDGVVQWALGAALGQDSEEWVIDDPATRAKKEKRLEELSKKSSKAISAIAAPIAEADKGLSPVGVKNGSIDWSKIGDTRAWASVFGQGVGSMALQVGAAYATRGRSLSTTGLKTFAFMTSAAQMLPGYLEEARASGIGYNDAFNYAAPMAAANGLVELVGLEGTMKAFGIGKEEAKLVVRDVLEKNSKDAIEQITKKNLSPADFQEVIINSAKKSLSDLSDKKGMSAALEVAKKVVGKGAKSYIQAGAPEAAEEIIQGGNEYIGKELYNNFFSAKEAKVGEGKFNNDFQAQAVNTLVGSFVGGVLGGGQSMVSPGTRLGDATMFSYANADVRHQLGEGAASLSDVKSAGKLYNTIDQWREDGLFDVKQGNQVVFDENAYNAARSRADMMYSTAWQFRNYESFTDTDRLRMYQIASTRETLNTQIAGVESSKQRVAELDQLISNPDLIQPDQNGEAPTVEALELEKANITNQLGRYDDQTGTYVNERVLKDANLTLNRVTTQAIPAINNPDTKALGSAFFTNAVSAIQADIDPGQDNFLPQYQTQLPNGKIIVTSEPTVDDDGQIRELTAAPIASEGKIAEQIQKGGKYKPVDRVNYRLQAISDFDDYQETFNSPDPQKLTKDVTKTYNTFDDASEVMSFAQNVVQSTQGNPDAAPIVEEQLNKAYDLYNQIQNHKDAEFNGVPQLTKDEFIERAGLPVEEKEATKAKPEAKAEPAAKAEPSEKIEDSKEAEILEFQKRSGKTFDIADEYTVTGKTGDTLDALDAQVPGLTIPDVTSAMSELVNLRKRWASRRNANNRQYTLDQINQMIEVIEADLERLADEKSYIEDPELRPEKKQEPAPTEEQPAETEQVEEKPEPETGKDAETETKPEDEPKDEAIIGSGSDVDKSGPSSIQSQYIEERELEATIRADEQQTGELRSSLEPTESTGGQTDEIPEGPDDIQRSIELVQGVTSAIESSNRQSAETTTEVHVVTGRQSGDSGKGKTRAGQAKVGQGNRKQRRSSDVKEALSIQPSSIRDEVLQYFIESGFIKGGNKTGTETGQTRSDRGFLYDLLGRYSNKEEQHFRSIARNNAPTVSELAHKLWEQSSFKADGGDAVSDQDFHNEILSVLGDHNTRATMVQEMLDRHNIEEQSFEPDVEEFAQDEGAVDDNGSNETEVDERGYPKSWDEPKRFPQLSREEFTPPDPNAPVPFSFSQPVTNGQANPVFGILEQLAKAFPNINLSVPNTIENYLAGLNSDPNNKEVFDKDNRPYGYVSSDGSVVLDPERLNSNTAIHEYGHIWTAYAKQNEPTKYKQGIALAANSQYARDIKNDPRYAGLNEEQIANEALAQAIGDKGEKFTLPTKKKTFKEWMKDFFNGIKERFGLTNVSSPEDLTFEDFVNNVVRDLMSGKQISGITSAQAADILAASGNENPSDLSADEVDARYQANGYIQFSWKSPTPWGGNAYGGRPGETAGTAKDYEARAQAMLSGIISKPASKFTPADNILINQAFKETGWKFLGNGNFDADMSKTSDIYFTNYDAIDSNQKARTALAGILSKSPTSFTPADIALIDNVAKTTGWTFTGNNNFTENPKPITYIPREPSASSKKGAVAAAIDAGINKTINTGNKAYNAANETQLKNLQTANIETLVSAIDDGSGLPTQLLTDVKRITSRNRDNARNTMLEDFTPYQRSMSPFTTTNSSRNDTTVKRMSVNAVFNDKATGKLVQKEVYLPVGTVMNWARTQKTQEAMGLAYLTSVDPITGARETHSSLTLDDAYFNRGVLIDPANNKVAFDERGVHKGARMVTNDAMEVGPDGKLVPLTDSNGNEIKNLTFLTSNREAARIVSRFDRGVGAEPGEVQAFKNGDKLFNNTKVQEMIKRENDDYLNPSDPFNVVSYYSPLKVYNPVRADEKVNSFSPNLEDSKVLHSRTGRPGTLNVMDDVANAQYYMEGVSNILGNARLAHNAKTIRDVMVAENTDVPYSKEIVTALDNYIEGLQNQKQSLAKDLTTAQFARLVNTMMNKYISSIFRFAGGISLTQISTYFSAAGTGFIKNKYLYGKAGSWKDLAKYSAGGFIDSLLLAGSNVDTSTGKGLKNKIGLRTVEANDVEFLFGNHLPAGSAAKAKHDQIYATIRYRAMNSNNQYLEGVNFWREPGLFAKRGGLTQLANQADAWLEEHGMAPIRRTDRAVIFSFLSAARRQANDMVRAGELDPADYDYWVAKAVENTIYATNQMNDITDTTPLQRSADPLSRIVTIFTGQSQKLLNNGSQATIEYSKYRNDSGLPAQTKKRMSSRLLGAVASNVIAVPLFIAASRIAWDLFKKWSTGRDIPDQEEYMKKYGFETVRAATSILPGLTGQIVSMVISLADYDKWSEGLFEIPGQDLHEDAIKSTTTLMQGLFSGDNLEEKAIDAAATNTRLLSVYAGIPKIWFDIAESMVIDKGGSSSKTRKKPVDAFGDAIEEYDFDDEMNEVENEAEVEE